MESQLANLNNFISKNECGGLNIEGKPDISCLFDKSGNILKSISGDATLIISIKFVYLINKKLVVLYYYKSNYLLFQFD